MSATGGDAAALHKVMMEEALYGCDVMPSAVHITGSTLSGVEPSVLFNSSHLYTMPYGRMSGQQRDDRLPGASPVFQRADAVQHQRPGHAHRQRRVRRRLPRYLRRDTGRAATTL